MQQKTRQRVRPLAERYEVVEDFESRGKLEEEGEGEEAARGYYYDGGTHTHTHKLRDELQKAWAVNNARNILEADNFSELRSLGVAWWRGG